MAPSQSRVSQLGRRPAYEIVKDN